MKKRAKKVIDFIRENKKYFLAEFGVKKIGIFGSYARGDAYIDSDIDIVVELKTPDLFNLIGIKQTIEEALGTKVDIVRLREKMNKALKERIERDVLYV